MPGTPSTLQGLRALVVDDEPLVAAVTSAMLEWAGCEVTTVENGLEALELFAGTGPGYELLVTDLMMPGMSGVQLVAALGERGARPAVVLVSGYATAMEGEALPSFVRFLGKPFTPSDLKTAAEEALRAQSPESPAE